MNKTESEQQSILGMLDYLDIHGAPRQYLVSIWSLLQVFDDIHDGDKVDKNEFDAALWGALVHVPCNPFFQQYSGMLGGVMNVLILKWRAANIAESTGKANEQSFMWRAGYFDLLMAVYSLVHGQQKAEQDAYKVMSCYIEKLDDYNAEFNAEATQ